MLIDTIVDGKEVTIQVADRVKEQGSHAVGVRDEGVASPDGLKKRGRFQRHELVIHETLGLCRIIEEWGMWRSFHACYKPCVDEICDRCGSWTYEVTGSGIYDVLCPDSKTRSVNQRWLKFANTEAMRQGTSPSEAEGAEPPKGLGRDGNKPLMRNRSDDASLIGTTGGDQFNEVAAA